MGSPAFIIRILFGVIFTFWLIQSIQNTVIPKHFRYLRKPEFYLLIGIGTVLYIAFPIAWSIIVIGLYLYHFKIRP
jgi:hypothetical protein